jgi:DNA-binding NarL/FixJ family response regulator
MARRKPGVAAATADQNARAAGGQPPDSAVPANQRGVGLRPPTRVLLVDDHELVRDGLRVLIGSSPGLEVCGEAADEAGARNLVRQLHPDVVVVDLMLRSGSGLDLIKWIKENRPEAKVIVSTMHEEKVYGERALYAGANGYVNKQDPARAILTAIRHVLDGGLFFSEGFTSRLLRRAAGHPGPSEAAPLAALSDRELDVFRLIGQGLTSHEVARRLHVSRSTVDTYRERLKTKLELGSGAELTHLATRWVLENEK